jgi:hypothetical protein
MNAWLCTSAAIVALTVAAGQSASTRGRAGEDERPPHRLEETGLYEAGRPGEIAAANRSFSPQYPLWSDGAAKSRWVFLPPGGIIIATETGEWDFPVGTRFWKEFRFDERRIETRMLWKASPTQWVAASYAWNAAGTDAILVADEGRPGAAEVAPGRWHAIPSVRDCQACHGSGRMRPLGFNALQLSDDRDPGAIHGEPVTPGMTTLASLVAEGLLARAPGDIAFDPPRIQASHPLTRSVLGYLAANCGSCHDGSGEISVRGFVLRHGDLTTDADAVARGFVGMRTAWQVPGAAEGEGRLIDADHPELSAILLRMRSRRPSSQMPPLGTVVRDEAAVAAVTAWISLLTSGHGVSPARSTN